MVAPLSSVTQQGTMISCDAAGARRGCGLARLNRQFHLISNNMNPGTSPRLSLGVILKPEVERCQQEPYALNAMARGPFHALSVVALAAGASRASSSVSAGSAMEAADVAATSAAVRQKLNLTPSNDWLVSSTSN